MEQNKNKKNWITIFLFNVLFMVNKILTVHTESTTTTFVMSVGTTSSSTILNVLRD